MKILATLLVVACSQFLQAGAAPADSGRIVCYFGSWAVYRYGAAKITANDIQPELCTHLIYTFVGLDPSTNSVQFLDAYNDIGDDWKKGLMPALRDKSKAAGTKFLVAIGGWNEGSEKYSQVVSDPARRAKLVKSIVKFVDTYKLDGFDLDWEYPAQRGGKPSDREAFSQLTGELKREFAPRGWILSAAVSGNKLSLPTSYNVPVVSDNLDMINIMAYDLHGSWEDKTGHNAPLYARKSDYPDNAHLSIVEAVNGWINLGANPRKLNLGLASYGRSFTLQDPSQNRIGAPAGGMAPAGWTSENGFFGFDEICSKNGSVWTSVWDDEQQVPYAYSGRNWVGYDDPASLRIKSCYAKERNLGGIMLWTIETDDFRGNCGKGKYPLIQAMRSALVDPTCGRSESPEQPPATDAPQTEPPVTDAPQTEPPVTDAPQTEPPATDSPQTEPPATDSPVADSPAIEETVPLVPAPETTTAEIPQAEPEQPNDEIPVVPGEDNSSNNVEWTPQCPKVGDYLKDPNGCSTFYVCTMGADGNPVPLRMSCASGTNFDSSAKMCQHKSLMRC